MEKHLVMRVDWEVKTEWFEKKNRKVELVENMHGAKMMEHFTKSKWSRED